MRRSEKKKEIADRRRTKWNKAKKPYFNWCLHCDLSCQQIIAREKTEYSILNCPRKHNDTPKFPYKYEEMVRKNKEGSK